MAINVTGNATEKTPRYLFKVQFLGHNHDTYVWLNSSSGEQSEPQMYFVFPSCQLYSLLLSMRRFSEKNICLRQIRKGGLF